MIKEAERVYPAKRLVTWLWAGAGLKSGGRELGVMREGIEFPGSAGDSKEGWAWVGPCK